MDSHGVNLSLIQPHFLHQSQPTFVPCYLPPRISHGHHQLPPQSVIKCLPPLQMQFLPRTQIQFLPPTQLQFLPPTQLQFLPPVQLQSPPPAVNKSLPPVQIKSLPSPQHLSQLKSLPELEPLSTKTSPPEPLSPILTEHLSMAQMINNQRYEQGKNHVSRNNSSNSKYSHRWMVQSKESLQKQHAAFHKASFGQVLFCCFTLDSEWFFCLEEIGLPVKASRDELKNCLTNEDLDCMLLIEDISTTLIHLTKNDTYLLKMLDAVEKIEKTVLKDGDIFMDYLLEIAHPLQIVQQTWNEISLQSGATEQKKILTLFLMKLYQQHVNDFDDDVDPWEKIRKLSVQDAYVADAMQEKGEDRLKDGNLEEALEFFNAAINNCPLDVNCYKQRAKIHKMLKNYKLSSCDLIRVHVLEPDWEEGYDIHDEILKNLDEQWTKSCFNLIGKWKFGAHYYYVIKTIDEDKSKVENDSVSPSPIAEKNNEKKVPLATCGSDKLIQKAMQLYKQQKFKEMLQLFKANILETVLYQLALLSHVHLQQLDKARKLASTAVQTFTDPKQFSGDKQEVINLKKMFNFIKSLPPTPFGQCGICKTNHQSRVASIYIYSDSSMLDDIFHKGCVVLSCENRCKMFFHFECISGSNDSIWNESSLKVFVVDSRIYHWPEYNGEVLSVGQISVYQNYIRTICSTPDCQSCIVMAEAFFVDNAKSISVADDILGFKRPDVVPTETSRTNLTAQNPEQNNNAISGLASSDEATLPSDISEGSTQDLTHSSGQAQAAMLNDMSETKTPPSYKEYKGKKAGKNKKKRSDKKAPLSENVEFCEDDFNLNQNLTNGFQPENYEEKVLEQSLSESSKVIEKENLLLYLCSVLHVHGPQSATGETFQNEIKALSCNHKKLLSESGGLACFLLQSDNVLLKEPDILFLEDGTMNTVIPAMEHQPLQSNPSQVSATGEDSASSTHPPPSLFQEMSASGFGNQEERMTPRRNRQINESVNTSQDPDSSAGSAFVTGDATDPEPVGAQAQNAQSRKSNHDLACADMPSASLMGPPEQDPMEEIKRRRNLPPDKMGINILDQSSSDFEESSSSRSSSSSSSRRSSEQEKETGEGGYGFSFLSSGASLDSEDSSDGDFPRCESCANYKSRLEFLEHEYRTILDKYHNEKRNHENAEQKISSLEAQLEAFKEENTNLTKQIEGAECLQSGEASNIPRATTPKSILRTGRRSLPSHLKGPPKHSHQPKMDLPVGTEEDIILCVICHEDLSILTVNTLQCGHVFHDKCIRKWFVQQKTCPSCRKHTLLTEEFPPLA